MSCDKKKIIKNATTPKIPFCTRHWTRLHSWPSRDVFWGLRNLIMINRGHIELYECLAT